MARRIKIMHIAQAAGGVSVYIESLVRLLNRDEFENILVCSQDYEKCRLMPYFDSIEEVSMERSIQPTKMFKPILETREHIKKYKPDIIYCHSSIAGVIGRVAALGCNAKILYNAHGWSFNMRVGLLSRVSFRIVERMLAFFTDKIVCVSEFEKESAKKNNICPLDKLEVVYNGVDVESIQERVAISNITRDMLGIPSDAYVVGMVGRISEQKAPDVFIEAARIIKKSIPSAFFIIVGDGPDRENIESKICMLGLKNSTHITGWVDNSCDYMALFDQPMLLSLWEAFGLALVEYMAAGKSVVCTNADAIPELVKNGVNGVVVNIDDATAAAAAVIRLYGDENLREKLSVNALKVAKEKFDMHFVVKKMSNLFKSVVE